MAHELKIFLERLVPMASEVWADMEKIIQKKSIKKNEHFLKQGEICKRLGFIVKGYVRVYYLVNGDETTKDFNFENSFCGSYASFSLQQPSLFNAIAMEDTTVYTLNRDELFRLFDKHAALQKVGRLCIEHMFIRKELREASFLLKSAQERYNELIAQYPSITGRVPLRHLASYLGIRPETLSRIRAV